MRPCTHGQHDRARAEADEHHGDEQLEQVRHARRHFRAEHARARRRRRRATACGRGPRTRRASPRDSCCARRSRASTPPSDDPARARGACRAASRAPELGEDLECRHNGERRYSSVNPLNLLAHCASAARSVPTARYSLSQSSSCASPARSFRSARSPSTCIGCSGVWARSPAPAISARAAGARAAAVSARRRPRRVHDVFVVRVRELRARCATDSFSAASINIVGQVVQGCRGLRPAMSCGDRYGIDVLAAVR